MPESFRSEPKDLRYRRQLFPEAEALVFSTSGGGFAPLPIILRKLFKHLSAPELRLLVYLHLRASRYGICYPTMDEMAHELGLARKNLSPHLKSLEQNRFISTALLSGRRFFLIHDPRVAVQHLATQGRLAEQDLTEINSLYEDLGQVPVDLPANATLQPGGSSV